MGRLDRDSERLAPLTPRAVVAYFVGGVLVAVGLYGLFWGAGKIVTWLIRTVTA